jgi:amidase
MGPLHGVPISLKDQFHVKGVETTMGYVGWIGTHEGKERSPKTKDHESEMVRELRNLGAILYVKTSVPHTLMSGETVNNIIGYTWNPKNRNLCAGGSSGGEGALIGLRGSPAGFGTDIGGSIRIPAGFNGLYGIRGSAGRLPYEGMANSMDGQNSVLSVVGPLATTARSTTLLIKSILSQKPWLYDPLVVDMPWREDVVKETQGLIKEKGKLAFAVMRSDGVVNVHPPVARAIQMCVDALEKAGHEVIEWKPPSHEHGLTLTFKTWLYDGGKDIHGAFALSGEPMSKQIAMTYGEMVGHEFTASEIAENNVAKRQWQKDYMDYWNSTAKLTKNERPVDGVICPLAPYAAARPEKYQYYGLSSFVNGLDYTSVVVPVTEVDKRVDKLVDGYKPMNDQDKTAYEDYDPEIYDGAHVSVQLMGRRFQEEKMMVLAEYLGDQLGKSGYK